jgi:SprT protein
VIALNGLKTTNIKKMQLSLFQPDPPHHKPVKEDPGILMRKLLEPYLPDKSIGLIIDWLIDNKVKLRISNNRTTKLGDYRTPKPGSPARISVNHNLNKYAFLITLVHEMAHHMVLGGTGENHFIISFRKKRRPKPHGTEWQSHYRKLMAPFLSPGIFPPDIIALMKQYLENPKASTTADLKLSRILKKYDMPDGSEFIENLPFNAVIHLRNGRSFHKKEKIRKRYRCICLSTGRVYLFNPMAQVFL